MKSKALASSKYTGSFPRYRSRRDSDILSDVLRYSNGRNVLDSIPLNIGRNMSRLLTNRSFMQRLITGYAFLCSSTSGWEFTFSPSNHLLPLYSRLKKASIMERLRDFPKRLGLVKRNTSNRSLTMSETSSDLSTK